MKIAFVGDIALIGQYDITKNGMVKDKLQILANKLAEYDYVVGNLESPLTDIKKTLICKSMHLKSSQKNVEILKYLHVDAVSLANNHSYDFGTRGLNDTISVLEKHDIQWFGINNKTVTKKIKGEKITLSGFACYSTNGVGYARKSNTKGINPLKYDTIIKQLKEDENTQAFSIMSFHWGDEHTNYPKYEHLELVKKISHIKNLIIHGHHPHVIQGIQRINNSFVSYSLGNFLFDDTTSINGKFTLKLNESNRKTFILGVEIKDGSIVNHTYIGIKDKENAFEIIEIDNEINDLTLALDNISSRKLYEEKRRDQIGITRIDKFGRKNLKWLLSRFNLYSIGAKISAYVNAIKFKIVSKKFK